MIEPGSVTCAIPAPRRGRIYNGRTGIDPAHREFSTVSAVARMLHLATSMLAVRSGDTLRDIAARYLGFAMIGGSVILGELLARADVFFSGDRSRA